MNKKKKDKNSAGKKELDKLQEKLTDSKEEIENLREELEAKEEEVDEYLEQSQRIKAEFMNYKKRVARISSEDMERGAKELAGDLLVILDNLERALDSEDVDLEGIDLISREFYNILKKRGVRKMEAEGEKFDHNYHHAISYVEDENSEDNTIVEVLEPGYFWKDKVLRPAKVVVSKKK
ncbi:MAG: nucleotide exchange factor GrpE [Elusimicrobiota bacterium]